MTTNTRRARPTSTKTARLTHPPRLHDFKTSIHRLARSITRDEHTRQDLEQEMACHLLTLGGGQTRAWYRSRLCSRARDYRDRRVIDAPLGNDGRPALDRQTVCVGGLAELDHLARAA
ncbi:MAG: hypothetical protein R6V58_03400 [Planctomycetota bacterium]